MDSVVPLAGQLVTLLSPFLPHLMKAGQSLAESAVDEVEKNKARLVESLWGKLFPKVEASPAASEAVQDAAAAPDDADLQAALRVQLRKLLSEDPQLVDELRALLESETQSTTQITNTASGDRSVVVGGSVQGGTIITGDSNRVT